MTRVVRVALLELVEARTVDDARDDFADVVRLPDVGADDAVDLGGSYAGSSGARHVGGQLLCACCSVETIVRAWCSAWSSSSAK